MNQEQHEQRKRTWSQLAFDFTLKVEGQGDIEVRSSVGDVIRWERLNGRGFMDKKPGATDLLWLGWAAAKRQGLLTDDFDTFTTKILDFSTEEIDWEAPTGAQLSDSSQS